MNIKNFKTFSIIIILFCAIWGSYKIFLLYYYRHSEQSYIKEKLDSSKDISITLNKDLANNQFVNMNLFIPEEYKEYTPSNFQEYDGNGFYQKLYSSNNETIDIWLQKTPLTMDDFLNNLKFRPEKLLKKYNISNEIELLRYYKNQKSIKRSIFWNKSRLQMDYLVSLYLETSFNAGKNSEDYNFIAKDLNGIMTSETKYIVVRLLNGKEQYLLNFNKNSFTKEQVKNILKSIYFA